MADQSRKSLAALSTVESTQIKRVRAIFEDANIVAIGIAQKVTENKPSGELGLCFYVEKKRAKAKLKSGRMIPPVLSVADRTAVFTDVQAIGKLRLEINRRAAPLQSGYSVGRLPDTGTLGAIVQKGKKYFILEQFPCSRELRKSQARRQDYLSWRRRPRRSQGAGGRGAVRFHRVQQDRGFREPRRCSLG